jgi:hypothetical protein
MFFLVWSCVWICLRSFTMMIPFPYDGCVFLLDLGIGVTMLTMIIIERMNDGIAFVFGSCGGSKLHRLQSV